MTDKLAANIDAELARIEQQARSLADEYWYKHWQVRSEAERKHWGYIGCRVRTNNGIPVITWYRARYWRARNKTGEKKSPTLEHLKKGQTYSYSEAVFRRVKAKQWEIDKAMELEVGFAALRREIAMLTKMRRYLHEYRKAIAQRPNALSERDLAGNEIPSSSGTASAATETPSDQDPAKDPAKGQPQDPASEPAGDQADNHPGLSPDAPTHKRRPGSAETPPPA